MSAAPKVSVLVPTYEYAHFLPRALDSVLAQTFGDWELVVSDNASTDATPAVVAGYAEREPRLRAYRNDRNLGLFGNFARCLELARGEYVKFVCADDWLDPRYLEEGVAVMDANPGVGLLTSAGWLVDEEGETWGYATAGLGRRPVVPAAEALRAQAEHLNVIGMPSNTLLRRTDVEAVGGFDPAYAPASDLHLWLKLLARGDLGWLPDPRTFMRIHPSKSHDYGADPDESAFRIWEDLTDAAGPITPELRDRALAAEGERYLLYVAAHAGGGRAGRARDLLATAARHVPWPRLVARLAARAPTLARGQVARLVALRTGRLVAYTPPPRMGPPRSSLPAEAR
jgi:Glycosyl transferase family 2